MKFMLATLFGLGIVVQCLATPVPLAREGPVPVAQMRAGNPAILPLTGSWKFQITKGWFHEGGFQSEFSDVTASSSDGPHKAVCPLGEAGSYWRAADGSFPQWWQVDFGKSLPVKNLNLLLDDAHFSYEGRIELSRDGKAWHQLADLKTDLVPTNGQVAMEPSEGRYLRVMFTKVRGDNGRSKRALIRHVAVTVLRDGRSMVWQPELDAHTLSLKRFYESDYHDHGFASIPVPANWEVEGFSKPTYDQPDDAVGLYRRVLDVPAAFAGKQVLWHFDGVFDTAEIFINGQRAGAHEGGFTAFDIDVTKYLQAGKMNLFAVRVCKNSDSVDLDTGDYWALGGIYRETYLVALPPTHVADVTLITDLTHAYQDANLKAAITITGQPGQSFTLASQLHNMDGSKAATPEMVQTGILDDLGNAAVKLSQTVTAPKLWSAEKPNLYYLVTSLAVNGQESEWTQERFGFKQIEIRDGVLLWNGVPIKCTGTCRHEEWAVSGHALTEQEWETDVTLMKAANINAIRTSHYIDAERFLELCDEKGFYVLDEIPFCWADPKNETYLPAYLQRTEEAFARDKNRPCVLAWSMGNESGFGLVNNAGFERIKKLDPTRPAFISGATTSDNTNLDLLDFHYPHPDQITRLIHSKDRETKPALITEGPHTIYTTNTMNYDYGVKDFWGQGLNIQWNLLWPVDTMLGGFIWEWQDQGLADKFPDRTGVDAEGLRSNNHKGFVDGYRHPKPEYFNVKMVYSPVVVTGAVLTITNGTIQLLIQNRYSFTDISELSCHWEAFAGTQLLDNGVAHFACAPRSSRMVSLPATPGMDAVRLEFIHPDGRSIYFTRLESAGRQHSAPAATQDAAGAVALQESGSRIEVTTGHATLTINKTTGAIVSWTILGQSLLAGAIVPNLGVTRQPMKDGGEDSKNSLISQQWPILANPTLTTKPDGDVVDITVSNDVRLVESTTPKGVLVIHYGLHSDGQLDVDWELHWQSTTSRVWELGLKLPISRSLKQMHWRHAGLWSEYPSDHISATEGIAGPSEPAFGTTKRDLQWLTMSSPHKKYALCVLPNGRPLHSRARLEKEGLFLYASSKNAPLEQDLADGMFDNYFIFLKSGETYTGGFSLRPVER